MENTYSPEIQKKNPYTNSEVVARLTERYVTCLPLRIAFLDIDSCMTGTPEDQKAAYYGKKDNYC